MSYQTRKLHLSLSSNALFRRFDVLIKSGFTSGFRGLACGGPRSLFLISLFFLFGFCCVDSGVALSFSYLGFLVFLSLDFSPRLSSDTSHVFDSSASSFLSIDFCHGSLFVFTSVEDGPGDFTWVFLFMEKLFRFSINDVITLSVKTDESLAMSGIDFKSRKLTNFGTHGILLVWFTICKFDLRL